jgi:hypothetical protein
MSIKLGLKIKIGNEEKDLDDIFLKISDYNANSSNYQADEAVQLTQNTGIKYIDEFGAKRDLIDRYIGYDSDGYIAANYESDSNRIDVSDLNAITDICGNNLVNLFYQLGTKKLGTVNNEISVLFTTNNNVKQNRIYFRFLFQINTILFAELENDTMIIQNQDKTSTYLTINPHVNSQFLDGRFFLINSNEISQSLYGVDTNASGDYSFQFYNKKLLSKNENKTTFNFIIKDGEIKGLYTIEIQNTTYSSDMYWKIFFTLNNGDYISKFINRDNEARVAYKGRQFFKIWNGYGVDFTGNNAPPNCSFIRIDGNIGSSSSILLYNSNSIQQTFSGEIYNAPSS